MSLDVYLETDKPTVKGSSGIFFRECGAVRELTREEWDEKFPGREPVTTASTWDKICYEANITHNLNKMASEAGLYIYLWRPDENGIDIAGQLIDPLQIGLDELKADPDRFKQFNPDNNWGSYEQFVIFVEEYLEACMANPSATVSVSR